MGMKAKAGNFAVHHMGNMDYQVIDIRNNQLCGNFRNLMESFNHALRLDKFEKMAWDEHYQDDAGAHHYKYS